MLTPLSVNKLPNHELAELVSRSLAEFDQKAFSLEDDLSLSILAILRKDIIAFKKSLEVQHIDQNTKAISQADSDRDDDLFAFKSGLRAYIKTRNADKQAAYNQLKSLLSHYKGTEKASLIKESAKINALLTDLGKEPYKTALKTLNMQAFVTNLTDSQARFEAAYDKRHEAKGNYKLSEAKTKRAALQTSYIDFCDQIEKVSRYLTDKATYPQVLASLNQFRNEYAESLKQSKSKKASAEKEEEEKEEEK